MKDWKGLLVSFNLREGGMIMNGGLFKYMTFRDKVSYIVVGAFYTLAVIATTAALVYALGYVYWVAYNCPALKH